MRGESPAWGSSGRRGSRGSRAAGRSHCGETLRILRKLGLRLGDRYLNHEATTVCLALSTPQP